MEYTFEYPIGYKREPTVNCLVRIFVIVIHNQTRIP